MYSKFIKGFKLTVIGIYLLIVLLAENKLEYLLMGGIVYWLVNVVIEALVRLDPELLHREETYEWLINRLRFVTFNLVSFIVLTCVAVPTGLYNYCAGIAVLLVALSAVTKIDRIVDL